MISATETPPARSKRLLHVASSGGWLKYVYHDSSARSFSVLALGTGLAATRAAAVARVLRIISTGDGRPARIRPFDPQIGVSVRCVSLWLVAFVK